MHRLNEMYLYCMYIKPHISRRTHYVQIKIIYCLILNITPTISIDSVAIDVI